ncbi:flavin-containing monooxygenase [Actinophytocola oryzae]|uniref:Cation diffusion facilitator CzcD-associated flavoprotein CzcO n=1 Tax=Actinophytocola oryzae TaxID=502181 RepID=A0A4R7VQY5_9PSEU|nr:NAD(P)/FAD-dependent oxidoreductase [Actinophytocola oryzae]TDV52180.1 cation diffusion facilitator CzcD-associated flavoprotein CzcO [Actinophytocola oryzae]
MEFHTVVIGTGFSGLGMAIQLRRDGRRDFVVLEKAHDVGGTWRDNTYPGCACDIQSHMYSFSFAQNPDWTRSFSPQPEILGYLRGVADRYGLREHIRFGVEVAGARWDADERRWHVATSDGEYVARFLVAGIGALHLPNIPKLPGVERFDGETFHSARWNHDYDLAGKRVAVVGTGASAIQFVPRIAPEVAKLTLFQRTPPWIMPKPDHEMPGWAKTLFRRVPGAQRLYRDVIYWLLEARAAGFNGHPVLMRLASRIALAHLHRQVEDPGLRRALTPDYVMGCKRVLVANDYYPALTRDNVEVDTSGIREVTERGVVDGNGVEHEVDVIIYGTGFHVTDAYDYLEVTGVDGRDLAKEWRDSGIQTHLGITVSGFPNLFFLLGPNTGLGHNSVVFMIESQIRYVSQAMALAEHTGAAALDIKESAQAGFQSDIQRKLAGGVWTRGGCDSWYLDSRGVNRTIWPGFTWRYWQRTRRLDPTEFDLVR